MKTITSDQVHAALRFPEFIDTLDSAFAGPHTMPPRQVLTLAPLSGRPDAFAMLPCWNNDAIAQKAFTYFPENQAPLQSLYSQILLFDRNSGEPRALVDGVSVTCWRTAGVSALASRFLSRSKSATLLLLGTGKLAPYLLRAHASVRSLTRVLVWGRSLPKVDSLIRSMADEMTNIAFEAVHDLADACSRADIVVCATGCPDVLILGEWVQPGTHTDFLGNHRADQRECDTALVTRSRVYVDSRANCLQEAGELLIPMAEGAFTAEQVVGELSDLCRRDVLGRQTDQEITLFKSVGCALGDLCGAQHAWRFSIEHGCQGPS